MREIKFRAWDKHNERMILNFIHYAGSVAINEQGNAFKQTHLYNIMQYTGLKDSKNQEIYDGDILKVTSMDDSSTTCGQILYSGYVNFVNGGFCCSRQIQGGRVGMFSLGQEDKEAIKIIGNIHENPELLEST